MRARNAWVAVWLLSVACTPAKQPESRPPAPANTAPVSPPVANAEAFRATRPAPGAPGDFQYPTPKITQLDNGLTVYWVRRPTRVVQLSLVVRHGASSNPRGKSGLAGLTARMLTEGTRRKPASTLAEAVESLGTTLGAEATRDESSIGMTVLPGDVPRALALLAEVATEPAFSPREFERVRAEWLDSARAERQNPQRLAVLAAMRALHGPVRGAPVNGGIPDVERLTVADLVAFHREAYAADQAALIVVGEVDEAAVSAEVARLFKALRPKSALKPPEEPAPPLPDRTRVLVVDRPSAVQSALVAVQVFPKRSEPGHEAREILGRALGGLFTSRLNTNLREKHAYTYGAFAQPAAARGFGTLVVSTSVRTDVTAPALDETIRELRQIRDPSIGAPLSPEELARAKADLVFSLGATLEHPSRVAETTAELFVEALPADYHTRYPQIIAAVSAEAVQQAAHAVTPDRLIVVLVGDRSKIEPELKQRGYGTELAAPALLE